MIHLTNKQHIFNLSATDASKGMALLLLLWHHLFYEHPEYGMVTYMVANLAKVCVSIFLILSGYGLTESIKNKRVGLIDFYKKRLIKLYLNYWFIAAIFVPIGIFFMDRSLIDVFGNYEYIKFAIQMSGLHMFTPVGHGYNITWWFVSLIIALYILFPLIYILVKKFGFWFIVFTFFILLLPGNDFGLLQKWIFPFVLGIYISQFDGYRFIMSWLGRITTVRLFLLVMLMICFTLFKKYVYSVTGVKFDWLFAIIIILFTTEMSTLSPIMRNMLQWIGVHSFNIFLFHTFIYYYYWKDITYFFYESILIFLTLLIISLAVSVSLEYIKKFFFLDRLYMYFINIKTRDRIFI